MLSRRIRKPRNLSGASGCVKPSRQDAQTAKNVASNYSNKGATTSGSYNKRRKEAIDEYWDRNAIRKGELQQELGQLHNKQASLTQRKSALEREIKSLNTKKLDPRIMFNKDEKNIIQGQLNKAMSEKASVDKELAEIKTRISEIMTEMNKDRLFEQ